MEGYRGIAVVGLPGSGKSTFLAWAEECGAGVAEWSEFVLRGLSNEPADRAQAYNLAEMLVASRGVEFYPQQIFDGLSATGRSFHVISGARNPAELDCLERLYAQFDVVWISSNYIARFERGRSRSGIHHSDDLHEFVRTDLVELAGGLASIGARKTNSIMLNDDSLREFEQHATAYLSIIKGGRNASP
jgi:dephospho-CoA kinase